MCTVSGVFHSLADGILCIVDKHMNGALFQGDQVVKSCYEDGCDLHVVEMATLMLNVILL